MANNTKIFKNKETRERIKKFIMWIDESYDEIKNYDTFIESLNDTDKSIINLYEENRLDDNDSKCDGESIFNYMIPEMKNINLDDSELILIQQRTKSKLSSLSNPRLLHDQKRKIEELISSEKENSDNEEPNQDDNGQEKENVDKNKKNNDDVKDCDNDNNKCDSKEKEESKQDEKDNTTEEEVLEDDERVIISPFSTGEDMMNIDVFKNLFRFKKTV